MITSGLPARHRDARPPRGSRARAALFIACLLSLLAGPAPADKLTLKDGRVIDARIISEDGAELQLDVRGIRTTLAREQVVSIERVSDESVGPGEAKATEAIRLLDSGDAKGALEALVAMDAAEPEAYRRHDVLAVRLAKGLRDSMAAAEPARAIALADLVRSDASIAYLRKALAPQDAEDLGRDIADGEVKALLSTAAGKLSVSPTDRTAEADLQRALRAARPEDPALPAAWFHLSSLYYQLGLSLAKEDPKAAQDLYDKALAALVSARNNLRNDPSLTERVTYAMDAMSRQGIVNSKLLTPTPTPTPAFVPPATPVPTPSPTPLPPIDQFKFDVSSLGLGPALKARMPDWHKPREVTQKVVIPVGVFALGFWIIPWGVLRLLSKFADLYAPNWRRRVFWMGPFALAGWAVQRIANVRWTPPKAAKNACPHCHGPLEAFDLYADLDFNICPHCKKPIRPVTTLEDYIGYLANTLATDAERVNIGAASMNSLVEKDAMQRLTRGIFTLGLRRRSSDIHIEPEENGVAIRHRIDGMMTPMVVLPRSLGAPIVSAIKVMANMDISEKRKPQDGAIQVWVDKADLDIRVATAPSSIGEKATLRLLDIRAIQVDPRKLGMPQTSRETFEKVIHLPDGLVLVTGPTGSGKTTTLYVALQTIKTGDKNLISIEDPIEFRIPGINQIQVNPAAGLTFANGLRSILRQDPDVIMVGEIRDRETADIAIDAATTGHLVFSTLHTIDAAASIARLIDLGVTPRRFADALALIIAQRLVRLICPDCKEPFKGRDEDLEELGIREEDTKKLELMKGKGCELCNYTGYFGRTGIFEMMVPDSYLRGAIERGSLSTNEIRDICIGRGMRTLRVEGVSLLRKGVTTIEEILRVTK